mmetsp:Transcript_20872/g.50429  ORF Transcript_20872/g.50429 Transcript_20872/m.50429 type:complete len:226 (-) Transcript_20872:1454-2131(-)
MGLEIVRGDRSLVQRRGVLLDRLPHPLHQSRASTTFPRRLSRVVRARRLVHHLEDAVRLLLDPKRQRLAVQLAPRCDHRLACHLHLLRAGRWLHALERLQIRLGSLERLRKGEEERALLFGDRALGQDDRLELHDLRHRLRDRAVPTAAHVFLDEEECGGLAGRRGRHLRELAAAASTIAVAVGKEVRHAAVVEPVPDDHGEDVLEHCFVLAGARNLSLRECFRE